MSKVLSSNIATTLDICNSLGFRNSKAGSDLYYFSLNWLKTYTTSGGCSGTRLFNWKCEQEELKFMAEAFLFDAEKEGFWSRVKGNSMPNSSNEKTLDLLKQLLWKQNEDAVNNAKYCHTRLSQYDRRRAKRQKRAGDHNEFMRRTENQSTISQQLGSSPPPLASLWTDAPPPTESQPPPHVKHAYILTTQSKGRVLIPVHTLLHSNGMTRQSFWEDGRFGSKSLGEFLPGLAAKLECALNDIEKIKLVLRLKIREVEVEMETRREDIWEMAIATFRNEIRRAKEKGEVKGVSVLVEPVMRKGGAETVGWDEDEEIDL